MQPAILIVDDEPHLLRLFVRVFEREGFAVQATGDGAAAREIIDGDTDEFVALVLDAGIGPIGASSLLERLLERRPGTAVVLVSGDHLTQGLVAWIDAHGGRFLRKPFLPSALIEAVRTEVDAAQTTTP